MIEIKAPSHCPECNDPVIWKNDIIYCVNPNCSAKNKKAIEHWAKTMKIKGLGPQSIEKLELCTIPEIYELEEEDLVVALGSQKLAEKLYHEIEKSKLAPLEMVLPAFGIPLIGNSATQKLCSVLATLNELTFEKAKQAGLGPKATENLMKWFNEKYLTEYVDVLPFSFRPNKRVGEQLILNKGVVCITGKLKSVKSKAEAENLLKKVGYQVKPSITKEVTVLLNESGIESAKTQKAREAGLRVITNLRELIGEK